MVRKKSDKLIVMEHLWHKASGQWLVVVALGALGVVGLWWWHESGTGTHRTVRLAASRSLVRSPLAGRGFGFWALGGRHGPMASSSGTGAVSGRVWELSWGSGVGRVGRLMPKMGAPEGPMSFDVDAAGRLYLLDQVNDRIEVFGSDGVLQKVIGIPDGAVQDLALLSGKPGRLALLDRLVSRRVFVVDGTGRVVGKTDLQGPGIPEPGGVTALFARDDGLWVEVEHRRLVCVADRSGWPDRKRPEVLGRPDGARVLRAKRMRPDTVWILEGTWGPFAPARLVSRVRFDRPVRQVIDLEGLADGRILVAVRLKPNGDVCMDELVLVGPDGVEMERQRVLSDVRPEETYRQVRVGRDGNIYHMSLFDDGVTIRTVLP